MINSRGLGRLCELRHPRDFTTVPGGCALTVEGPRRYLTQREGMNAREGRMEVTHHQKPETQEVQHGQWIDGFSAPKSR